jgi:hypothetical protein
VEVQHWISCSILSQEFALLFDASWNLQHVCGRACCSHFFLSLKFLCVSSHPWLPLGFRLNIWQQVSTVSRVSHLLLKIAVKVKSVPFIFKHHVYEHTNCTRLELHYSGLTDELCVRAVFAIMRWKSPFGFAVRRCCGGYIVEHHTQERRRWWWCSQYKILLYSSAPVFTGNTFQDLPRLCETADNTERYI